MSSITQNGYWNAICQKACRYVSTQYHKGIIWIQSQGSHAYSQLPAIQAIFKQCVQSSWRISTAFLWRHKAWVISAVMAAAAWRVIQYIRSKIPQYPIVKMVSTLDVAELQIEIPKELRAPLNVTLTFCIDTSASMQGKRIEAVKSALEKVLSGAQSVVNRSDGARIRMTVVGFDTASRVITPITEIIKGDSVQLSKKHVRDLKCNGGTDILAGLDGAVKQLQEMAKADQQASHTVILLTDGDSPIEESKLSQLHKTLTSVSAKLFAIGIGAGHKQDTLQKIVGDKKSGFSGTYIDTTQDNPTIEGAIASIYEQAISSFQGLTLSSEQLDAGTWSVGGKLSVMRGGRSVCDLEPLSEGEVRKEYIKIYGKKLTDKLDLSSVLFKLSFTDPKGRQGTLSLLWNPDTLIRPQILKAAKTR